MYQPSLAGFLNTSSTSRKRRREEENSLNGKSKLEKGKVNLKKEKSSETTTRGSRLSNDDDLSVTRKPVNSSSNRLSTPSGVASPSASKNSAHLKQLGPASLDSTPPSYREKPSYLPTPMTITSNKPSRGSTAILPTSSLVGAYNTERSITTTPTTYPFENHHQQLTPATPTRQRPAPKISTPSSSYLPSPPQSSFHVLHTSDTSTIPFVAGAKMESQTIVPSSQTQLLEISPSESSCEIDRNQQEIFQLPTLPRRLGTRSGLSHTGTNREESDEDTCVIPSSQTQELIFERPSTPPRQSSHRAPAINDSQVDSVPNSRSLDLEVFKGSPRRQNEGECRISVARERSSLTTVQLDVERMVDVCQDSTQREIIPTSQCMNEEELTTSDVLRMKARTIFPDGLSGAPDSDGVTIVNNHAPVVANIFARSPTRARILRSPEGYRTPSRRQRSGQETNLEDESLIPILKQAGTPRTPKTPYTPRVRFSKDNIRCKDATPQSSQTEPESSQWHVDTQHIPTKRVPASSQTELESSQWHVSTQSSQTEAESSQWRVSTQYTPSRNRKLSALQFCADDHGDPQDDYEPFSLPIASYDEESEDTVPPPESTSHSEYPPLLDPNTVEQSGGSHSNKDGLIPGASSFDLSQIGSPRGIERRMMHVSRDYGPFGSQSDISGTSVSIPVDYDED